VKEDPRIGRIRDNVRKEIALAGYGTVELFAHEHGIDKSTLSRLLSGKREPRLSTLFRIADSLEIMMERLLIMDRPLLQAAERPVKGYKSFRRTK